MEMPVMPGFLRSYDPTVQPIMCHAAANLVADHYRLPLGDALDAVNAALRGENPVCELTSVFARPDGFSILAMSAAELLLGTRDVSQRPRPSMLLQ